MKLIVIGAGTVGGDFAIACSRMSSISKVVVADINLNRAREISYLCKCESSAMQLDITDHSALVEALKNVDIVGSAVGPASRFGTTILRAVIETGKSFVEIGDDPYPTLDMLSLDKEAKTTGANAVVNMGASPGITNMLGVAAAETLDHVEKLTTVWGSEGDEESDGSDEFTEATAALTHWVEQVSVDVPIWKNGRLTELAALTPIQLDYPSIGKVTTYLVGHPEAVTLPQKYPDLNDCINVMDFSSYLISSLRTVSIDVRKGRLDYRSGAKRLIEYLDPNSMNSARAAVYLINLCKDKLSGKRWLPAVCALAEGYKDGVTTRVGASLSGEIPGGMGPTTGIPAAVAVDMMANGEIVGSGVRPPETAIQHELFFNRLKPYMRDNRGIPLPDEARPVKISINSVANK